MRKQSQPRMASQQETWNITEASLLSDLQHHKLTNAAIRRHVKDFCSLYIERSGLALHRNTIDDYLRGQRWLARKQIANGRKD